MNTRNTQPHHEANDSISRRVLPTRYPKAKFVVCTIMAFMVFTVTGFAQIMPSPSQPENQEVALPSEASKDWWGQIQESIQLEQYHMAWFGGDEQGEAGFRAVNPQQGFAMSFGETGFGLSSMDKNKKWQWGLSLKSWGRFQNEVAVPPATLSADDNRMEYSRPGFTEWFVNGTDGLEHGFTLSTPPVHEGQDVVLNLDLTGSLRPVFAEDGQSVDFYSQGNVSVLRYSKLLVTDAYGSKLSARMEPVVGGLAIVFDDSQAIYPVTVDPLATTTAWAAVGENSDDYLAYGVTTAGDVNGDGFSDVIVGAPGFNSSAGKVYLYLGGAGGLSLAPAWEKEGSAASSFGLFIATAGDVNGDGYSDVIVGADAHNSFTGKAYLYLGSAGGLASTDSWSGTGEALGDRYGSAVATAGDVNSDGYSDVLVGSWKYSGSRGKSYLYLGSAGGLSAAPSWTVQGEAVDNFYGFSLATAGDVNGDGFSDVVVGAFGHNSDTGKAYLYMGGAGGLSQTTSWTQIGESAAIQFGLSVAGVGDVNGDGFSDVAVGAPAHNSSVGKGYVFLGSPLGLASTPDWEEVGDIAFRYFGHVMAPAGDIDGDGYADLAVGGRGGNTSTGKAFLFLGGFSGLATSPAWSQDGEGTINLYSWSINTAGDVNGDGYSDLIVGAWGYSASSGKAYLYLGSADVPSLSASWQEPGETTGNLFGYSVAGAGDVNGDGYSDVLVGAYGNNGSTGKAYLFPGSASGLLTTPAWTAGGEGPANLFGHSVAGAGDVNGDGYNDIIIGAKNYSTNVGRAYVFLGGAAGVSSTASWIGTGEAVENYYGASVASAGDVNGDGYSDVAVGAYRHTSYTGKVYVYLGSATGLASSPDWTGTGEATSNYYGESVASVGDVNGDGFSDLVVGARLVSSSSGRVYVYLGSSSGLAPTVSWTATGETTSSYFGFSVASAGDVNGDGFSDLAVGAYRFNSYQGKVYVYMGGAAGLWSTPVWSMAGDNVGDRFGYQVASAGDVNGDGFSDLIVGANKYNSNAGRAYLYTGSASFLSAGWDWIRGGKFAGDNFGNSVAGVGDVNGDGFADVLVGAYGTTSNTGYVYSYSGNGGKGIPILPRQLRQDLSAPISPLGPAYDAKFRLALTLRSPMGRGYGQIEWQLAQLGETFHPVFNPIQTSSTWWDIGLSGAQRTVPVDLPDAQAKYTWRARIKYSLVTSPFLPHSPWVTLSSNGLKETDLMSTLNDPPPVCDPPDEPVWIYEVTLSVPDNYPILHFQDPNQPDQRTGYHVRRSDDPGTPKSTWSLVATNVVDMDEATANIQWTDTSEDVPAGGTWYYQVTAYSTTCATEGPF